LLADAETVSDGAMAENWELAIFDLDNTLIGGDSDYLWMEFLIRKKVMPANFIEATKSFYEDYEKGQLDLEAFLLFQLAPLASTPIESLEDLRRQFIEQRIKPIILTKGKELVRYHQDQGHDTLIVTATNRFVTGPISLLFGVSELIAIDLEVIEGCFTGRVQGVPSFGRGKVTRLEAWLVNKGRKPSETWFYSDSRNDLPLLEWVDHAIAVDPDPILRQKAIDRGWPVLSLR
jgi:HAD superfamily hydrolase (TIGR01490 family)